MLLYLRDLNIVRKSIAGSKRARIFEELVFLAKNPMASYCHRELEPPGKWQDKIRRDLAFGTFA